MPRKASLLTLALVGPSSGPFGPMGGIKKPRGGFKRGGKFAGGGEVDPLAKAVPPVPKAPSSPFTYYSPEAKAARHQGLLDSVIRRNDAEERLKGAYRGLRDIQRPDTPANYAKGGKVPGFIFGGLFGGTPAQQSQNTQSYGSSSGTTNNQITDPAYNQLRGDVLSSASALDFSDPSKYIAGFNADQTNAFQGVRNNQGAYNANFNAAQGDLNQASAADPTGAGMGYINKAGGLQTGSEAFNPFAQQAAQSSANTVSNYMSPFQKDAMGAVADASNTAFQAPGGTLERITDQFTGGAAAQFGRERHGDAVGNAVYNQQNSLNQQLAQMANQGWQSSLTAAGADQNRLANLGQTAGSLANQDIQTQQGLGTAAGNLTAQGAQTNIAAGQAQQKLGLDRQGAGYTDANALLSIGNQQQQLEQQRLGLPLQGLQYQQSLAQGWQLPTTSSFNNQTSSNTYGGSTATQAGGSPFGQVVGAGAALAGAMGTGTEEEKKNANAAHGGQMNFNSGGYVPTVTGVRKRNAMRAPQPGPMGGMGGMQPTGMPGMPPMAPPTAAALNPLPQPPQPLPHPANRRYARGGTVFAQGGPFVGDAAQDRAMVERGIHQHERGMHKATSGELTKLRLARGGGVPHYGPGGTTTVAPKSVLGALDEDAPTGPFGTALRIGQIGPARGLESHFGPNAPLAPAPGAGAAGAASSSGAGGASTKDMTKVMKGIMGLFGGSESGNPTDVDLGITPTGSAGTGAGGAYAPADFMPGGMSFDMMGEGWGDVAGTGMNFARGGALDEDAPEGPFGDEVKTAPIASSQGLSSNFGPLPGVAAAPGGGGGGAGGGGGGGGSGVGGVLSGAMSGAQAGAMLGPWGMAGGAILGGLFSARGGQVPGYAQGGYDDDVDVTARGGTSPFLDSSAGLENRKWLMNRPMPPQATSPEVQARMDSAMEYERNKSDMRRWLERVSGDIAKPVNETVGSLDRGDYLAALMPMFTALDSANQGSGVGMALKQTARELQMARQAQEAAKQGIAWRKAMGW